jgi:hypothetical protein
LVAAVAGAAAAVALIGTGGDVLGLVTSGVAALFVWAVLLFVFERPAASRTFRRVRRVLRP